MNMDRQDVQDDFKLRILKIAINGFKTFGTQLMGDSEYKSEIYFVISRKRRPKGRLSCKSCLSMFYCSYNRT